MSAEAQKYSRCTNIKVCLVCGDNLSCVEYETETVSYKKSKCERCGWFYPQQPLAKNANHAKVIQLVK